MKLVRKHTDLGVAPVWELAERDATNEFAQRHLVRHVAAGELLYLVPLDTAPTADRFATGEPNERSAPVKPSRPDPRRVDPLRAALRRAGFELRDRGAHYFEVVQR